MASNARQKGSLRRHVLTTVIGTFFLALSFGALSQLVLEGMASLAISFILLMVVIALGIFFDVIGVAATAARETALHAKASRRLKGASQAYRLIRRADRVASFCCDVVGDVCGTLSGAIGAAIILQIVQKPQNDHSIIAGTVMTALVAAVTVGGKAGGKSFAINHAETIMYDVGRIIYWWQARLGIKENGRRNGKKGRRS